MTELSHPPIRSKNKNATSQSPPLKKNAFKLKTVPVVSIAVMAIILTQVVLHEKNGRIMLAKLIAKHDLPQFSSIDFTNESLVGNGTSTCKLFHCSFSVLTMTSPAVYVLCSMFYVHYTVHILVPTRSFQLEAVFSQINQFVIINPCSNIFQQNSKRFTNEHLLTLHTATQNSSKDQKHQS